MSSYILAPVARQDLADMREYYLEEAGYRVPRQMMIERVEAFSFLARTSGAGHKREDLAEDRPILFWPMRDYLILYEPDTAPLQIVKIVSGSQKLPKIIGRRAL